MSFFAEISKLAGFDELKTALGYTVVNFNGEAVYVDGIVKVLRYENDIIMLETRGAVLEFTGAVTIKNLDENAMIIGGSIVSIRETQKEKHAKKKS